ncbi:transposase family protein [Xylanimonas allomyrinae]|uniref:Transposase family protein n=1 Tax=Xylanimonas allomyrinae TaxID=2509459 RepID=A0A4P6EUP5_9MICO|nr:transposase family protein [Xylanimonas allomyrinae]
MRADPCLTSELIARAFQVHAGQPDGQRYDFALGFGTTVTMVLMKVRHNLAQQLTGHLFGIWQPTVSRIWRYLLPILGQVTATDHRHLAETLERGTVLVDGTPIPTGNRTGTGTTNFNAKHHKQALGIRVAAFYDGRPCDVSLPVHGSRHNSRAPEEVGWADQITAASTDKTIAVLADTAYVKHTQLTHTGASRAPNAPTPTASGTGTSPPAAPRRMHHRRPQTVEDPRHRLQRPPDRTTKHDPHDHQHRVLPTGHVNNALTVPTLKSHKKTSSTRSMQRHQHAPLRKHEREALLRCLSRRKTGCHVFLLPKLSRSSKNIRPKCLASRNSIAKPHRDHLECGVQKATRKSRSLSIPLAEDIGTTGRRKKIERLTKDPL